MSGDKAKSDGFILLCLGALVFVATGFIKITDQGGMGLDFRMVHHSARCLIEHRDPYKQANLVQVYRETGGKLPCCSESDILSIETRYVYLPTIFVVTWPLGFFPVHVAFVLWTMLATAGFIAAAVLMWDVGKAYAPRLTGALLCLLLANSGTLMSTGNAASLAISLSVIAAWCFLRERAIFFGIICLAGSLAIKPHDSLVIWGALLLLGGTVRKRAIQSAVVLGVAALPVLLWMWHIAPHWSSELQSHVSSILAPGGLDDPGPSNVLTRGSMTYTNLQSVLSFIWDDPRFYNPASYAIGLLMVGIFVVVTTRWRTSKRAPWLAMAFACAVTLLPFYHRHYDSKLLILTIPACAFLWSRNDRMGKLAVIVSTLGLLMASDLLWAIYIALTGGLQLSGFWAQLYLYSRALPIPCSMAIVALYYLLAYTTYLRKSELAKNAVAAHASISNDLEHV